MNNITNFSYGEGKRQQLLASFGTSDADIEKSNTGEGSRGGKVIGHTKSGKPLYAEHGFSSKYKDFSAKDHNEASEENHVDKIMSHYDKYVDAVKKYEDNDHPEANKHYSEFEKHLKQYIVGPKTVKLEQAGMIAGGSEGSDIENSSKKMREFVEKHTNRDKIKKLANSIKKDNEEDINKAFDFIMNEVDIIEKAFDFMTNNDTII